jgi:hypothetical protein
MLGCPVPNEPTLQEMAQAHATSRAKQNAVPENFIVLASETMFEKIFVLKKGVASTPRILPYAASLQESS